MGFIGKLMTKVADKLKEKLEGEEEEEVGEEECEEDEEEEDCEDEEAEEEYEEEDEEAEEEEYEEEEYEEEEEEEEYEEEAEDCEDKESAVVLPKGWIQQYSNQYNCPLYCNTKTGETQWHAPGTIPPKTSGAVQRDPYQAQHSFRGTGNKKALLVGINYEGTDSELSGCINDAINLKQFIVENYGYNPSPQTMLMLTDDATDRKKQPTLKNLLAGFYWLVSNTKPGDELFFSYSGHGGQIEDDDGDRSSGLDCTLCPADYDTAGQIRSDDVHKYLVAALPEGVKLTVIMDCCHSGTMMELPYTYRPDANGKMSPVDLVKKGITIVSGAQKLLQGGFSMSKINDAKKLFEEAKGLAAAFNSGKETTQGGYKEEAFNENSAAPKMVFCLSGCRDEQTSADATFDGKASGALTYAILKSLEANRNLSYEELLLQLRGFMKGEFSQIPQLSCGVPVDPKSPFSF